MTPAELLLDQRAVDIAERYRQQRTTSVLTIVFTDIEGSTALREALGEVHYERLRAQFDDEVTGIIEHGEAGAVVKSTGDGVLAVFSEPSTSVERCIQIQRHLREHPHFKLRIGIDMGQVSVKSSQGIIRDVFGRHVNRASRIEGLASPGHVLTSFPVYDCAVGWLKESGIRWHNHGTTMLKGIEAPVSIHEVYEGSSLAPMLRSRTQLHEQETGSSMSYPQSRDGWQRPEQPMFHRSGGRGSPVKQALPVNQSEWADILRRLIKDPIKLRETTSWDEKNPYASLEIAIGNAVSTLRGCTPEAPSLLWINGVPGENSKELDVVSATGIVVEHVPCIEVAFTRLASASHAIAVVRVRHDEDVPITLELLGRRKALGVGTAIIVSGSPRHIGALAEQATTEGAALCTPGAISLLNGIADVLRELCGRLPWEWDS